MSEAWSAEERVSEERARRLIRSQFPELAVDEVALVSEGWDYVVYRVDGEWAFRFPRRSAVIPGTGLEIAVLPRVAPLLPVEVPVPVHVGRPGDGYPWPFYGAAYLPGAEPDASLLDEARVAFARPLARVLRALHASETLEAVGEALPEDPLGRADMAVRVPRVRETVAAIADLWEPPPALDELLAEALELPLAEATVVCHGDLHFRQLLVEGAELTGLVDWVDLCRADPGVDLSLVYGFLSPAARRDFFAEYGDVAPASHLRARVLALNLMAILARYGHVESVPGVKAEALAGLDRVLS
jgi:aminoglycoside phosphotransferase (APT) family kinase protein